jgi:hypothetical protein
MKVWDKAYWAANGALLSTFVDALIHGDKTKCAIYGAVVTLAVFIEFVKWAAPRSVR